MNASVLDEHGKTSIMEMGCYGIGVSRIVAASIEQNHDEKGIIWPDAIAPFEVAIVTLNGHKSPVVAEAGDKLYEQLRQAGYDVLLDDRNERPGVNPSPIRGLRTWPERRNPGIQGSAGRGKTGYSR